MENAAARSIRTVRMRSEDRIFLFKILEEPGTVSSLLFFSFQNFVQGHVNDHNEYEEDKADGE